MAVSAAPVWALTIKDVRIGLHPDKTRMVLELDGISKFKVFVLDNPWRLVIDLPSFAWQAGQISKPVKSSVASIRQGPLSQGISRVVVDLKAPVSVKSAFLLRKNEGRPDRLVIDFTQISAAQFEKERGKVIGKLETGNAAQPVISPEKKASPRVEVKAAVPSAKPLSAVVIPGRKPQIGVSKKQIPQAPILAKKPLIVLDPGHGGVDPGAIGANGVFEKHVALAIAQDLRKMLVATGRYDVVLTRERDVYKKLSQRVNFARAHNADLFISLHADSIGKSRVRGASIYTLSEKASDEQTARLADRENKADIIAGVDIANEDEQVANILIDLAMRDTMNQSKFFANTIVEAMQSSHVKVLEKTHRSAGFAVLKAPDIPSVLIEIGFMSNKAEAEMLSRPEYRQKIARSIVSGVNSYFDKVTKNNRI